MYLRSDRRGNSLTGLETTERENNLCLEIK